jgi:hypothetical protein
VSIDPSIWVVVVLLIAAASAASYFASEWRLIARSRSSWTGIAAGGGAGLLLIAVIALLAIVWALGFKIPTLELNDRRSSPRPSVTAHRSSVAVDVPTSAHPDEGESASRVEPEELNVRVTPERSTYRGSQASSVNDYMRTGQDQSAANHSAAAASLSANGRNLVPGTTLEPWSATRCVVAFRIDPADATRWIIENDCATAVAILIASCDHSADRCATDASWRYRSNGILLPAKWQRPVTQDESAHLGAQIRFVACNVETAEGARLIGGADAQMISQQWSDQLQSTLQSDDCIRRVVQWSQAGSRSSRALDTLLPTALPRNGHERN